jgi:UDP-3-O-[3-hydroxymyristoyl] N-acetylglucosamine deacetylase
MLQRTIRREISLEDVGIHTGSRVKITILPADVGDGVVFIRDDLGDKRIPAHHSRVKNTELATTIIEGEASVSTVEHLMATLYALAIDNVTVRINGPEVPVIDGSAAPFVELINSDGITSAGGKRVAAKITSEIRVESNDSWAKLEPVKKGFFIDYTIVYENRHIGTQHFAFELTPEFFATEIAPARTFGLLEDVNEMRSKGLAMGGSLDNAVVIGGDGVLNPEGLRFPDECVRHKCLDAIGDLALFGMPIIGKFTAHKSGHRLNHELVSKLAKQKTYEIVEP